MFQYLDDDGTTVSALADRAQMTKQAMGELVLRLEGLGYVERAEDPADRRAKLVRPTVRGSEVIAIAQEVGPEVEARIAELLGPGFARVPGGPRRHPGARSGRLARALGVDAPGCPCPPWGMGYPKLRRTSAIVLGLLTAVLLAGCVRFQADLDLNPDDTVNGSIVLAVVLGDDDGARENAEQTVASIEAQLLPGVSGAHGATRSSTSRTATSAPGSASTAPRSPPSTVPARRALSRLSRDGDEFVFEGLLDFTPDDGEDASEPDADTSNITVAITFPGDVTDHNGALSGRTVSWEATPKRGWRCRPAEARSPPGRRPGCRSWRSWSAR